MNILVINSGSSSIKFSIFRADPAQPGADPETLLNGELSNVGGDSHIAITRAGQKPVTQDVQAQDAVAAAHAVSDELAEPDTPPVDAVGYRVVHPGPKLNRHQRITPEVLADLEAATPFAPLHEPEALQLIHAFMQRFPNLPHFACFDTVFHQTMPEAATTYPIPLAFRAQGVRRYGFHGLSCESVLRQLKPVPARLIIAHLGSGCSVTAVIDGKSVDTSMGLTPTGGVVMGTRPGDLDPGLIFYLLRQPHATIDSVETMLNHDAGLKALFGVNDMRKLRESKDAPRAALALEIFTQSVRSTIGGMIALHSADTLIFTGGIGEHDPLTREAIANALPLTSRVIPAQEDVIIALHVARLDNQRE